MRVLSKGLKNGVLMSTAGVFGSAFLWLLSFKAIAFWMGPEGVGLFSQLRQMAQAATIAATFGGTNSVVHGLAERKEDVARMQFRATAARLFGMSGVAVTLVIAVAAAPLTQFFLSSDAPNLVATVRWIALAVLLNVGGTYAIAVLNGYRRYSYLALARIAGPAALVMLLVGAWWWRLSPDPQLLAGSFVLCFGITYIAGVFGVLRLPKLASASPTQTLSTAQRRAFIRLALSTLVAALSATIAMLLIRTWVIEAKGLAFAGLFDAGWTLTFNYTTLFLTACNAIYLPLLTAATSPENQKTCILKTVYLVFGTGIVICYAMVLLKVPLINLLYSPLFQESGQVLMVLVIAVLFRGASWVYGTMILVTRSSRVLLISDLALNLSLLATTRFALDRFASLEALSWAFVLPNFLYLVFVVEFVCHKNQLMLRRQIWPLLLVGTLPLFFLALAPAESQWAYSALAKWLYMAIGLAVSAAALLAYKKVAP
ncbi:MAG: hypothetical protein WCR74_01460 [Betaproteobacteria bacterium]